MADPKDDQKTNSRRTRVAAAILIGLSGSIIIWVVTPYNNFIIDTGYISDSYLPVAALFLMLLLVAVVNPLLLRFRPGMALDTRQLALVMGMLLMASVIPGQGLMRMLPYGIAGTNWNLTQSAQFSALYAKTGASGMLFPDGTAYGDEAPASYRFLQDLGRGESIPWRAWMGPLASWGGLVFFAMTMMVGLAMIVLPQWLRNERLAFPLLGLERTLIQPPQERQVFGGLFRSRAFWIATAAVFLLHMLRGLHLYYPDTVPAIPLNWDLKDVFTEEPLVYLPLWVKEGQLYFLLLAVTFFMPSRISFSIWFFELAYAVYGVVREAYIPPWDFGQVADHRTGAMVALSLGILWLGRHHWAHVGRCLVRGPRSDEDRFHRAAGVAFLLGLVGVFAWLMWVHVQPVVALCLIAIAFMSCLLISRLVAETGLPFLRIDSAYAGSIMRLFPVGWFTAASVFFSGVISLIFQTGSRVSAAAMGTHALALDPDAPPRYRARTAWLFIGVMMLGVVICGAAHLVINYHHSATYAGVSPVNSWGTTIMNGSRDSLVQWNNGKFNTPAFNEPVHITFGFILASLLQWASLALPRWPLHPIGLLVVTTFYANTMWPSIFLGWGLKTLILRFGGAQLYRRAVAFFMGLIVGEILASAMWSIVPAVLMSFGLDIQKVLVQPM